MSPAVDVARHFNLWCGRQVRLSTATQAISRNLNCSPMSRCPENPLNLRRRRSPSPARGLSAADQWRRTRVSTDLEARLGRQFGEHADAVSCVLSARASVHHDGPALSACRPGSERAERGTGVSGNGRSLKKAPASAARHVTRGLVVCAPGGV
eukprot:scaffold1307_cov200-Pinguiococcus_pyrenoidosus.AAC.101